MGLGQNKYDARLADERWKRKVLEQENGRILASASEAKMNHILMFNQIAGWDLKNGYFDKVLIQLPTAIIRDERFEAFKEEIRNVWKTIYEIQK